MILCIGNTKVPPKLLHLITEFIKTSEYKTNKQKPIVFTSTSQNQSANEID